VILGNAIVVSICYPGWILPLWSIHQGKGKSVIIKCNDFGVGQSWQVPGMDTGAWIDVDEARSFDPPHKNPVNSQGILFILISCRFLVSLESA
jgi:hypothetical protein